MGDGLRPLHPELLDLVLSLLAFHKGRGLWHLIKTPWGFQNFSIELHFRPQCQVLGGLFLTSELQRSCRQIRSCHYSQAPYRQLQHGPEVAAGVRTQPNPPGTTSCSSQSHIHTPPPRPHTPCRSSELGEALLSISPDQMFSDLPVRSQHQEKCAVILDFTQ